MRFISAIILKSVYLKNGFADSNGNFVFVGIDSFQNLISQFKNKTKQT